MADELVCWKCGTSLKGVLLPLSRTAECRECRAELHVCRLCVNYNARLSDFCNETRAEAPRAPDQANFCDWFKPRYGAFDDKSRKEVDAARDRLNELFGDKDS